jgi:hypothetical protein
LGATTPHYREGPRDRIVALRIDDSACDDLRNHFTEDELVELGAHCAICVGMGRLAATWAVTQDVPDVFRMASDEPVAPWNSAGVVASG